MHLKHRKIIDIEVEAEVIRVAYAEIDNKVTGIYSIIEAWSEKEIEIGLDGIVTFNVLGIHKKMTLQEIADKIEIKNSPAFMENLEL
ncbi:MAG: hypothetical protein ACRCWM_00825 [Sarcina sp.]